MDDLVSVTVLHSTDNLLEKLPALVFCQFAVGHNIVKQFLSGIFQHHDDLARRCDDGIQLDDVWVAQELQVLNLSLDASSHISRDQLASRYNFQSDLLLADFMDGQFDLAKRALSKRLYDFVLSKAL